MLLTALPIAMIVIGLYFILFFIFWLILKFKFSIFYKGSTNQNNCTIETRIPVWLIVQGSVSIFLALILVLTTVLQLSR